MSEYKGMWTYPVSVDRLVFDHQASMLPNLSIISMRRRWQYEAQASEQKGVACGSFTHQAGHAPFDAWAPDFELL